MKTTQKKFHFTLLLVVTLAAALNRPAAAAIATKLGTGTDLTLGTSWSGGSGPDFPTSADVATWNNSSLGAGLTLGSAQSWGGISVVTALTDISVTGAGVLTLGASGVDMSSSANNMTWANTINLGADQVWNVNSSKTLTVGRILNSPFNLTKSGAGMVTLGSGGTSTLAGTLNVSAGKIQIGINDFTISGLTGGGTVENGSGTTRWLFIANATDNNFSGTLQNGGTARLGVNKSGAGVLTLSGAVTASDTYTVAGGKLILTGSGVNVSTPNVPVIGTVAGVNAVLSIENGASFSSTASSGGSQVYRESLDIGTVAGASGALRMSSGSLSVTRQLALGINSGAASYAAYTQSGGTATVGGFLAMGLNANISIFNQSGGTFTLSAAPVTCGAGSTGLGIMSLSSGAVYNQNASGDNGIWLGENGTGILNISGTATLNFATGNNGLQLGRNSSAVGVANLLGGTVSTKSVYKGAGAGTLNFDGGTLKANQANTTFLTGLTAAYVYGAGATIDNGGFAITVGQALLTPNGNGVNSISVSPGGSGYIDAPAVKFSGGGGSGATAVATVSGGVVTAITVTSAGNGYTSAPTITLSGGGGTGAAAMASIAANTSGGITCADSGAAATTTLSTSPTYTGDTTVSGNATLKLNSTGVNLNTSPNLNVSASMAMLDLSAYTSGYTLAAGQNILGLGTVSGALTTSSTSKIIPGTDGTTGTLTFNNSLTINGSSTVKFDLSATSGGSNDKIVLSGSGAVLTPNGAQITVNSSGTLDTSSDYVLIDLTGGGGATVSGAFNTQPSFVGTTPPNPLNYSIVTTDTQVLLHYNSAVPLSGVGAASPSSVTHGQSTLLTVTVTPGTSPASTGIAVTADLSPIGGFASQTFYDDGTHGDLTSGDNIFSFSTTATSSTSLGSKTLNATVTDAQSRSAAPVMTLTVVATSMTWTGTGTDDNFGTTGNWGGIVPGVGDSLFFAGSARPTPNMEANYSVDSVTFNSGATSFTVGTSSSTLTLTGSGVTNNSANPQALNVPIAMSVAQTINAASGNITLGGAISGGFGLTKVGSGTLTLSAANSYTGGTTVSAGTLQLQNASALAGSALTMNSGSTLGLQADADTTFTPTTLTMSTGGNNTFRADALTGAGNGHTLILTNNAGLGNGATTINVTSTTGDTLKFASSFGVSANGSSAWGGPETAFNLTGANVILTGMSANDGGMSVSSTTGNSLTINGNVSSAGSRTIYAKVNSGTLILNDTFTGGTSGFNWGFQAILNGGTLDLNNANAINSNASVSGHGNNLATLEIFSGILDNTSGNDLTLNNPTMAFDGTSGFTFQGSSSLNLGNGTFVLYSASPTINVVANTLTIGGVISGTGFGLTKTGNGTLTLSGANTYTGNTTINAGTLQLGNNNVLPSGTILNRTGGTVDMNGKNNSVNAFQAGGTIKAKGTWGSTASGATHQNNTYFTSTSTGVLTVTTGGATTTTLAAGGTSTYGDSVTFTATVVGSDGDGTTPSGTITFYDDGTPIGTGSLSGSGLTSTATLNLTALAAGTHNNITAAYGGSDSYDISTASAITQVVTPRAVQLTGSRNYDGSVTAGYPILNIANVVGGDTVSLSGGSATLASANGGLQSITANTLNLAGASAANYTTTGATGVVRINPAPANPYVLQATKNTPATNATSKLVAMAGDAGVTLSVSLSGADLSSPAHGSISPNGGDKIIYTPATDYVGADTFTYTLNDDAGGSSTGTVSVTVNEANVSMTLTIQVVGDTAIVTGSGIPNQGYDVQISPDLSSWSDYASTNAAANGVVIFTDPDAVSNHGSRSYRLKQQ